MQDFADVADSAWLEQDFESIETFGTGSDDVAVCELVGLGLEQHCRATEAFDTHSDDVSVSELNDVEPAGRKLG